MIGQTLELKLKMRDRGGPLMETSVFHEITEGEQQWSDQLTGAEEGGAGCGALPGGGVGIPHGQTVHVQIGGDPTGLNRNQVTTHT